MFSSIGNGGGNSGPGGGGGVPAIAKHVPKRKAVKR